MEHRETWVNGTELTDVSGGNETVAWDNTIFEMAWPTPLTPGTYDLIIDLNVSGYLGVWTNVTNPSAGEPYITDPIWTIYVTGPPGPEILINKTASTTGVCPGSDPLSVHIGDTVTYCFNVTNTGDETLTNITVTDDKYGPVTLVTTTLGPGISTGGTRTHIVTESDIPKVINTATVTSTDPSNETVTDTESCTVNIELHPDIDVNKTASPTSGTPGTNVTFTIDVTNIGDDMLKTVRVVDTLPAGMSYVATGTLPIPDTVVGNTITWTNVSALSSGASTTITLVAHIDSGASGTLNNTANATGTPPTGENVTDSDTADVKVEEQPPTPTPTPTAQVPEFTSVGLIALIGLLSVIAAICIKQRN